MSEFYDFISDFPFIYRLWALLSLGTVSFFGCAFLCYAILSLAELLFMNNAAFCLIALFVIVATILAVVMGRPNE
jgi:ABC-type branched-subunit amino acid transport system permease subunit